MRTKLVIGMIFVLIVTSVCIGVGSNEWVSKAGTIDGPTNYYAHKAVLADDNSLWILSLDGSLRSDEMSIRPGERALVEIIPEKDGNLILYERYPDGHIVNYDFGYCAANEVRYETFLADTLWGVHELWYNINQKDSNIVSFYINSEVSEVTEVWTDRETYNRGVPIRLCYRVLCEGNVELTVIKLPSSYSSKHIVYNVDQHPSQQPSIEQVTNYGPYWRTPGEYCFYLDGMSTSGTYVVALKTNCGKATCIFVVL